jgi:2'-5' RNA ligase
MRLFTAIDLSDEVRENIDTLQRQLKPAARIQWSPASNLHITTKFIGEWPELRLEELKSALRSVLAVGPIAIEVRQIGWFPNPDSPRVLFAGVHAPRALPQLAKAIDAAAFLRKNAPIRRISPWRASGLLSP